MVCLICSGELARASGPGRPPTYCSETCRRMAEYELRRLDRRIDAYETEQRELKTTRPSWSQGQEQRERRLRYLRKWIKSDRARLQELLAAGRGYQPSGGKGSPIAKG